MGFTFVNPDFEPHSSKIYMIFEVGILSFFWLYNILTTVICENTGLLEEGVNSHCKTFLKILNM